MLKAVLLFLIPQSIYSHRPVVQFSLAWFSFSSDCLIDLTEVLHCHGPSSLIFLRLLLLSHKSRMSLVIKGLLFFLALLSTSDAVSTSEIVYVFFHGLCATNVPQIVASIRSATFGSFSFSGFTVELESWAVAPQILLQLQPYRHHDQVVITADICSRKMLGSWLCWCWTWVTVVRECSRSGGVTSSTHGWRPCCSSGELVRKECIHHGHFVPVCEFYKSYSCFIAFSHLFLQASGPNWTFQSSCISLMVPSSCSQNYCV